MSIAEDWDQNAKYVGCITEPKWRTEEANAMRFIEQHGDNVRFIPPWGKYVVNTGQRWQVDSGCLVEQMAKDVIERIWESVLEELPVVERADATALLNFAKASSSSNGVANFLTLARSQPGIAIMPDALDRDPWLFNCENGTVDLKTGKLRPHSKADYITKLSPVVFDENADCPLWRKSVKQWMADDQAMVDYLRRLCGYWLTGSVRDHVLPILHGCGANGKSVFLGTIQSLLGTDYATKAAPDLLLTKKQASHPTEIADLFGRRLVVAIEIEAGRHLAESFVKEMTGADRLKGRRMREDFWEFEPTHKVVIAANHRPIVTNSDHGIWRRLRLVPFNVVITADQQDKDLPEKLRAELSGILNWCLLGCIEWQTEGLKDPPAVLSATEGYRCDSDNIAAFIAESCVIEHTAFVGATALFTAYVKWCEDNHERAAKRTDFAQYLTDQGYEEDRFSFGSNKGKAMRRGIGLRASEASEVAAG